MSLICNSIADCSLEDKGFLFSLEVLRLVFKREIWRTFFTINTSYHSIDFELLSLDELFKDKPHLLKLLNRKGFKIELPEKQTTL